MDIWTSIGQGDGRDGMVYRFSFLLLNEIMDSFLILFSERCTVIATVTGNKGENGSIGG